jgi:hypothetical protein
VTSVTVIDQTMAALLTAKRAASASRRKMRMKKK